MDERASGLILRTRPLTETSLIVHWLTREQGRLATVAKGARRAKSPFRGKLDLFYHCDFSFARSRRSELHTLREVSLLQPHAPLRTDLNWLRQASYAAELLKLTTETETPLPALFELFTGLLDHLPSHLPEPSTVFHFELKLLNELGLQPDPAQTSLSAGTRQLLIKLAEADWSSLQRLKLSAAQTRETHQFLHGFLIYHLGKIPGGRNAAIGRLAD